MGPSGSFPNIILTILGESLGINNFIIEAVAGRRGYFPNKKPLRRRAFAERLIGGILFLSDHLSHLAVAPGELHLPEKSTRDLSVWLAPQILPEVRQSLPQLVIPVCLSVARGAVSRPSSTQKAAIGRPFKYLDVCVLPAFLPP